MDILLAIIDRLLLVAWLLLLIRVVLSWVVVLGSVRNDFVLRLYYSIGALTEPMLAPIRRVLPQSGQIDLSVFIAIVIIFILRQVIASAA